jgi:hypothetical protein
MKGVIVQVGEPKSIVLYNNGKIGTIPTPEGCHIGMVVSVKLNNTPKIILIILAALLLLALGTFIGLRLQHNRRIVPTEMQMPGYNGGHGRGGHGRSRMMEEQPRTIDGNI